MLDLRTPKGTIDYNPKETKILEKILSQTKEIFKKHGAVSIDTPTFELKEILTNKYGEDAVNIFDLADQGGDICSLRFDLTVSFARYLAQNKIQKIKRYQIGKVFRRDQPAITKGRFREFYQCDFDIAGNYLKMLPDAEIIKIGVECLEKFNLGDFIIKINNRKLLNLIFSFLNIPIENHSKICSTIDKLAKISRKEIIEEFKSKGLNENQIQKLLEIISINGNVDVFEKLRKIINNEEFKEQREEVIEEFNLLFEYIRCFGAENRVIIDFSLARGMEYYTGMIFEGFYIKYPDVGAVLGGGRYDNLVDSLVSNEFTVPCVGFSIGVLRIFSLMNKEVKENETLVYIISRKDLFLKERLEILNMLWSNNIPAETFYTQRNSYQDHQKFINKYKIPIVLTLAENELKSESVKIMFSDKENTVKIKNIIQFLNDLISKNYLSDNNK